MMHDVDKKKIHQGRAHVFSSQGRIRGGGGGAVSQEPHPFWGTPNFTKRGKTSHACTRMHYILLFNSYLSKNPVSAPASYDMIEPAAGSASSDHHL